MVNLMVFSGIGYVGKPGFDILRVLLAEEGFALLMRSMDARSVTDCVVGFVSEADDNYYYRTSNF